LGESILSHEQTQALVQELITTGIPVAQLIQPVSVIRGGCHHPTKQLF